MDFRFSILECGIEKLGFGYFQRSLQSAIQNPQSKIRNPKSAIQNPQSKIQKSEFVAG